MTQRSSIIRNAPKRHKYNAKPCEVNGIKYRSQKEMRRHQELLLMEKAGEITDLKREVPFILAPSVVINGKKVRELRYFVDFTYFNRNGELKCEDTKGMKTRVYMIKRHLMRHIWDIEVLET